MLFPLHNRRQKIHDDSTRKLYLITFEKYHLMALLDRNCFLRERIEK
jgi:hypothetical protein